MRASNLKTTKKTTRVGAGIAVAAMAMSIGGLAQASPPGEGPDDDYSLPPTVPPTTIVDVLPPPPPEVTLPKTGSNGIGSTTTVATIVAAAGLGLVLVSRRRRDTALEG